MILHTILPLEQVMQSSDEPVFAYKTQAHDFIQGVACDGKFQISRVISTDPKRYLDPKFSPGAYFSESQGK